MREGDDEAMSTTDPLRHTVLQSLLVAGKLKKLAPVRTGDSRHDQLVSIWSAQQMSGNQWQLLQRCQAAPESGGFSP